MKSKKNISYKYKKKRKIKGGAARLTSLMQKGVKHAERMATDGADKINRRIEEGKNLVQKGMKGTERMATDQVDFINKRIKEGQKLVQKTMTDEKDAKDMTETAREMINEELAKAPSGASNTADDDTNENVINMYQKYGVGGGAGAILALIDLIKYTMLTVAGAFIYYPSFLINIPNSTLEEIVPTKEGCKNLFGSEAICKTKIKCLIKKCNMFEDPEGFRLKQNTKKGGSKKKRITHKRKKVHPYLKPLPNSMIRKLNKIYKKDVQNAKKHYKTMLKYIKYGGRAMKNEHINIATCKNKHNQVLCSNREKVDYDIPVADNILGLRNTLGGLSSLTQKGGANPSNNRKITLFIKRKEKNNKEKMNERLEQDSGVAIQDFNRMIESYIKEYLNKESCLKLLVSYKALKNIYGDLDRVEKEKNSKKSALSFMNKTDSGIAVPFPWGTSNITTTPEDRINCLIKHLTSMNLTDEEMTSDMYNKCFVCKNCTLLGTSMKVWDNLFDSMFTDRRSELKNHVNFLYNTLKSSKVFEFESNYDEITNKNSDYAYKYYATCFDYMHKYIDNENTFKKEKNQEIKDYILGIPKFKSVSSDAIDENMRNTVKQIYATLESLNIVDMLYEIAFDLSYKRILKLEDNNDSQRIYLIKRSILDRCKLFWPEKIHQFNIENSINVDDMESLTNDHTDDINSLIKKLKKEEEKPVGLTKSETEQYHKLKKLPQSDTNQQETIDLFEEKLTLSQNDIDKIHSLKKKLNEGKFLNLNENKRMSELRQKIENGIISIQQEKTNIKY